MRGLIPALAVCASIAGCGGGEPEQADRDHAVSAATEAYQEAKAKGIDLGRGPCIAEELPGLPDWVADIAHDPRQPVDDDPVNQCRRYHAGEAHHFVELTPQGELIRAQ